MLQLCLWRCWAPVGPSRAVYKPSQVMTQQAGVCSQLRQFQNKWRNSTGLVLQSALLECYGRAAAERSAPSRPIFHLALAFFFGGKAGMTSHSKGRKGKAELAWWCVCTDPLFLFYQELLSPWELSRSFSHNERITAGNAIFVVHRIKELFSWIFAAFTRLAGTCGGHLVWLSAQWRATFKIRSGPLK